MKNTVIVIVIGFVIFAAAVPVVNYNTYPTCTSCYGKGEFVNSKTCTTCKGKGKLFCTSTYTYNYTWLAGGGSNTVTCDNGKFYDPRGVGRTRTCSTCNGSTYYDCWKCDGYGKIETKKKCTNCGGDGEVYYKDKITIFKAISKMNMFN